MLVRMVKSWNLCIAGGKVKSPLWERILFLENLELGSLCNADIPLAGVYTKELKAETQTQSYSSVHSSIIHSSHKVETTQVSVDR